VIFYLNIYKMVMFAVTIELMTYVV